MSMWAMSNAMGIWAPVVERDLIAISGPIYEKNWKWYFDWLCDDDDEAMELFEVLQRWLSKYGVEQVLICFSQWVELLMFVIILFLLFLFIYYHWMYVINHKSDEFSRYLANDADISKFYKIAVADEFDLQLNRKMFNIVRHNFTDITDLPYVDLIYYLRDFEEIYLEPEEETIARFMSTSKGVAWYAYKMFVLYRRKEITIEDDFISDIKDKYVYTLMSYDDTDTYLDEIHEEDWDIDHDYVDEALGFSVQTFIENNKIWCRVAQARREPAAYIDILWDESTDYTMHDEHDEDYD